MPPPQHPPDQTSESLGRSQSLRLPPPLLAAFHDTNHPDLVAFTRETTVQEAIERGRRAAEEQRAYAKKAADHVAEMRERLKEMEKLEKNILKKKIAKKPIKKKPTLKASLAKSKDKSKDYTTNSPSKKPKRNISKVSYYEYSEKGYLRPNYPKTKNDLGSNPNKTPIVLKKS
ncbi:hypothetical protein Tdes44962_MAKER09427 [Teratosphaeria destructans]|uniref:Uncharacterized protein n=1 Tax=Teratosphaeria destructans TaxID=418781 RepID=A0A9W7STV4_9PEZI|nr:hypothetical protein Tdes44962_MAKER09427 [Teratosphaeria destructans]